jgi:hypothetical protein
MHFALPAMTTETFAPFVLLRAIDQARGECMNAGVVLFADGKATVATAPDTKRLKHLHPDFAALSLDSWAAQLQKTLDSMSERLQSHEQLMAMLPLLCQPFACDAQAGTATIKDNDVEETLHELLQWQVITPATSIRAKRQLGKKQTKLGVEIRKWLTSQKAYSSRIEDLSKHRVVANYPIDPAADMYADFALQNGKLNVMEIMDLRGVEHLTASMRGEAAVKGITLDEAKRTANPIAVFAASDHGVARPAIHLISRYASDVYDLSLTEDRDRFASFVGESLHRQDLINNALKLSDH